MDPFIFIGPVPVDLSQMERWRDGSLGEEWDQRYKDEFPLFFDTAGDWFYEHQGMRTAKSPGGYGFFETLAAIVLYHSTGYLPLAPHHDFQFYASERHIAIGKRDPDEERKKREIVEDLLDPDVIELIQDQTQTEFGRAQAPDLLMYKRDHRDWFFCDAKGPTDRLGKKQKAKFEAIAGKTRKPIRVFRFKWPSPRP